ncbi:MAG: AAA family ATPase [Chloroflexota bacterium]|nr:AAA family ATPase [Chloroflexota bacterium]
MSYSRFFLADLQVHTPADKHHRYGNVGGPSPNLDFARRLVEAHHAAGVQVIAVTDHNQIDWYPVLRQAGDELGVFVFPGVEVSVNGCHLLFIWDRTEGAYRLAEQCLASLWGPGESRFLPNGSIKQVPRGQVLEVAKEASRFGALVFAPHSTTQHMGLFASRVCRNSDEVAQSGAILGFDVDGDKLCPVLSAPQSKFGDLIPRWFLSGDTRSLDDVGKRAVYLKLSEEPSLEAIRQAFIAAETRIRFPARLQHEWRNVKHIQFIDHPEPNWPHLQKLEVRGGFHDGLEIQFGPGLNAIIGGKGTGKSTLIEIIRHVLDGPVPTGEHAKDLHQNRTQNFRANAEAVALFFADSGETYRISRSGSDSAARISRRDRDLEPVLVRKRAAIRVFGQRELQSYAQDPRLRREFVAWHAGPDWEQAVAREDLLLSQLEGIEGLIANLERQLTQLDTLESERADLKEKLDRARERGVEDLFQRAESLARANAQVSSALGWPKGVLRLTRQLQDVLPSPVLEIDRPEAAAWNSTLKQIEQAVAQGVDIVVGQLDRSLPDVDTAIQNWTAFVNQQQDEIQTLLAEAGFTDLKELAQDQQRLVNIERMLDTLQKIRSDARSREQERSTHLQHLESTRREQSRLMEAAAATLTAQVGQRVRVQVEPLSDRSLLVDELADIVKGKGVQKPQLQRVATHSPAKIGDAMRRGAAAVQALGCSPATAAALADVSTSAVRRIEQVDIPDVIRIEINVGSEQQEKWIDIDQASPGQRATAMLALALSSGNEPLIIDQPEDDLDNRYIYEQVVKVLGRVCSARQVIVATHNANIPVLGDAELIVALDAASSRSAVLAMGGLERPDVAHVVRHILEGGDEAFKARLSRYEAPSPP